MAPTSAMSPSEARRRAPQRRADELRRPVAECLAHGEVPGQREGEGDGRVEVGAGDVADCVDHRHDHEPEGDRDPDVAERPVFASTMIAPQPAKTRAKVPIASATSARDRLAFSSSPP